MHIPYIFWVSTSLTMKMSKDEKGRKQWVLSWCPLHGHLLIFPIAAKDNGWEVMLVVKLHCTLTTEIFWVFHMDLLFNKPCWSSSFYCIIPFYVFIGLRLIRFLASYSMCDFPLLTWNFCSSFRGKETEFQIEPELTLELMMAANYLHT